MNNLLLITNVDVFKDEKLFNKAYSLVSLYRQKLVDNYRINNQKYLSLATELLLKFGLEKLGQSINLNDINYQRKPYIDNGYHFNFSHSGKYTICAISENEVGCDIEEVKDFNFKVAEKCFSEKEYQDLLAIKDLNKQRRQFYYYWTAKEAYLKNIGTGFQVPYTNFETYDQENYYFRHYDIDDYILCTCCLNNDKFEIIDVDIKDILEK